MKNRNLIYLPLIIVSSILVILAACSGKNINVSNKEKLLKMRVEEFANLIEQGKFKQTRKYYIPKWQNMPEQEYKGDVSSWGEIKGVIDYYKIKSIKFRDTDAVEVLIDSSFLNKKYTTYDYWIFVKDNWYIVDYNRTDSVSSYDIKLYKELVQDNQK